jgi:hypothetical protein
MILLKVILILSMLYIAWEDFSFREVSLYAFVVFLIVAVLFEFGSQNYKTVLTNGGLNLGIVSFQLLVTYLYFSIIRKKRKQFFSQVLGAGDLLFYIPVIFLFSPLNFICIHLIGLLMILIGFALYRIVIRPVKTIPLAGGLSLFMAFVLVGSWLYSPDLTYDDMYLTDFLYTLSL